MTYLKYIQYFYLFAAGFFIYQGFANWNAEEKSPWMLFFFAALAIFMFFFRRRFMNKMDNRDKK
ncbi:hypothetical protein [Flavobacterium lacus]|jgi:hypothetical protein|uniref:hypothetical protein n=1 Tax=Flavobacterium lacus TaxID=1353778 RepID=UPI000DD34F4C|nr:hypothetical protein [Flavobacterium lacus]